MRISNACVVPRVRACVSSYLLISLSPYLLLLSAGLALAADPELPNAKPVPRVQVIPLPDTKASFQCDGKELTCYHFDYLTERPFCYPMVGPGGRSLTRMGHPHDPVTHSHHNSVWISHDNINGVRFWPDEVKGEGVQGQVRHERVEQFEDCAESAWLLAVNKWWRMDRGQPIMLERRRIEVIPQTGDNWLMLLDVQLETPEKEPVEIGQTPFGLIGVRMAKTIGVADGGGRILNSEGQVDEKEVFRKPAKWCDYSGPVTNELTGGITLMDHPKNVNHPTPFHVRNDGWMGACLTLERAITLEPGKPLRLRYGLWMHAGVPKADEIERQWKAFIERELPIMERGKGK